MLAMLRHIPEAADHVRRGGWNRDLFQGREMYGKTVGVIGYGRLGRIVARYLRAFDARVLAADPNVAESEPGIELVELDRLLRESWMVTLHVNLTDETRGFFGRRELGLMPKNSWLVNTARGELVDEAALVEALRTRRLAGAAVDVLADEHTRAGRLSGIPNLLVTPHIGGCTLESMQKTEMFLAGKLAGLLAKQAGECAVSRL
jgi:phosphoglycerate dehydrogenase-like enzyme